MIKVSTSILAPLEKVWQCFSDPKHVLHWNFASNDWHTPKAVNEFQAGGKFVYTMAAKDGSMAFDFSGTFTEIKPLSTIKIVLDDGRKMNVFFNEQEYGVEVIEEFEPEQENTEELQLLGWQAILDNFKKYVEQLD